MTGISSKSILIQEAKKSLYVFLFFLDKLFLQYLNNSIVFEKKFCSI